MKALPWFPYFLEKRLTIPTSPFSFTSKHFFCYLFPYFFRRPLTFILVGVSVGVSDLKWRQLAHNQLMSLQGPHFSPKVQLKPIKKAQISEKLVSSGISDVAFASVYSEKTRLKKLMLIMNKSQEMTVFCGHQKSTSAKKLRPEK